MLHVLTNRARQQPVLMLFEDAHWADASSLELLYQVVGLLTDLPILIVVSFGRSSSRRGWVMRSPASSPSDG